MSYLKLMAHYNNKHAHLLRKDSILQAPLFIYFFAKLLDPLF